VAYVSLIRRLELPTWLVAVAVHTAWLALTWNFRSLPLWLAAPLGAYVVAWHGSLQHEAVHGHPTRSRRLNAIVAGAPLWLWLPFAIYRDSHLAHHRTRALTDPLEDPESYYVTPDEWARMGRVARALRRAQSTLVGRFVLGPAAVMLRFWGAELRALGRGDRRYLRAWLVHLALSAALLAWVVGVCHISLLEYVACFVYPGVALTLLRSFAEHRPAERSEERSAIVEAGPVASLLFLNNNLHALHHKAPALAWYELPRRYRAERDALLADNGCFFFAGYGDLFWQFAVREKDSPVHSTTREALRS